MDVCAKFGDSRLKQRSNNLTLGPARPILMTYVQYLIAFCSRPEADSDVISCRFVEPTVPDKCVKFGDSRSNYSRDIRAGSSFCDGRTMVHDVLQFFFFIQKAVV